MTTTTRPYTGLGVADLLATGWRPTPFDKVVVKVHQRCNLACSYCYVCEHADQSWRGQPAVMPDKVFTAVARRLSDHVRRHDLTVVLHGGEPMLLGTDGLSAAAPDTCTVRSESSNGVLLGEVVLRGLRRHHIMISVSVDGVTEDHDRCRVTHAGKGAYTTVSRALPLLAGPESRDGFAGLLSTVAPGTDPARCHRSLRGVGPATINFLLPHANWGAPPDRGSEQPGEYGRWLIGAFTCHQRPGELLFAGSLLTVPASGALRSAGRSRCLRAPPDSHASTDERPRRPDRRLDPIRGGPPARSMAPTTFQNGTTPPADQRIWGRPAGRRAVVSLTPGMPLRMNITSGGATCLP